jgi:hypothetical protein
MRDYRDQLHRSRPSGWWAPVDPTTAPEDWLPEGLRPADIREVREEPAQTWVPEQAAAQDTLSWTARDAEPQPTPDPPATISTPNGSSPVERRDWSSPPPARPAPTPPASRPAFHGSGPEAPSANGLVAQHAEPVDLNTASFETVRELGLSVTQAARLIAQRDQRGGFSSLADLDSLYGFPQGLLEDLRRKSTIRP